MKYISYSIEALEDLKIRQSTSSVDNEYAISYILGSAIRGAFISKYINKYSIEDISKDLLSKRLFLDGDIKFLNAYLEMNNKRSLPMPLCFYALKDDIKAYGYKDRIEVINELSEKVKEEYDKVRLGEFCLFDNKSLKISNVKKISNLHINSSRENKNIFRYEAIKKGQSFKGVLVLKDEDDVAYDLCMEILNEGVFYFGGSKGSGYGKSLIKNVKSEDDYTEYEDYEDNFHGEFCIYALSDVFYRNNEGKILSYIDEEYLKEKLNLEEVKLEASSVDTTIISGYNNKWQCRYPQYNTIKKGSIIKYTYKGALKADKIRSVIDSGVGARREDGFGRITLISDLNIKFVEKNKNEKNNIKLSKVKDEKNKGILKNIFTSICENVANKKVEERMLKLQKSLKNINRLNRSQLGKLIEVSREAKYMDIESGKNKFNSYLRNISDPEKTNTRVYNAFKDVNIEGKNLYEYLNEYISKSDDTKLLESWVLANRKSVEIKNVKGEITREFTYRYNMDFLEQFFRVQLRRGEIK